MYVARMIEEVPASRAYTKRHLTDTGQLLGLIDEVLTIAPEFGDQNITLPLGAILDWCMGTPAGFAAFRDPRVNSGPQGGPRRVVCLPQQPSVPLRPQRRARRVDEPGRP